MIQELLVNGLTMDISVSDFDIWSHFYGIAGPTLTLSADISSMIYIDKWGIVTIKNTLVAGLQEVLISYNDLVTGVASYGVLDHDFPSEILILGAGYEGFIYYLKIYNGAYDTSAIQNGNMYEQGQGCVYPVSNSQCISDCVDFNKNRQCDPCNCNGSCIDDPNTCLECDATCNYFCDQSQQCIDILTYCSPHPYDSVTATCLWGVTCINNCQHCLNNTQCITCITGFNLQPDLSCGNGCPTGYYEENSICQQCYPDCSSCIGGNDDDCLGCSAPNSSLYTLSTSLGNGQCICDAEYFESATNPLVCTSCHGNCSSCTGSPI